MDKQIVYVTGNLYYKINLFIIVNIFCDINKNFYKLSIIF